MEAATAHTAPLKNQQIELRRERWPVHDRSPRRRPAGQGLFGPGRSGTTADHRQAFPGPFEISKQAVSKHIQVLEQAQLVTRTRDAQRRPVHLNPARLEALTAWIDRYRLVIEGQFRSLDAVLHQQAAERGRQSKDQHQ